MLLTIASHAHATFGDHRGKGVLDNSSVANSKTNCKTSEGNRI